MEGQVELEVCANCKKEIPHYNYVMHTAHCARNISLCTICKEPVPKNKLEDHKRKYHSNKKVEADRDIPKQNPTPKATTTKRQPPAKIEQIRYFQDQQSAQNLKHAHKHVQKENLFTEKVVNHSAHKRNENLQNGDVFAKTKSKPSLIPCKYCELELPKLDLEAHENYCGARTDKCEECGELVMFKYKELHNDTNHGFLKLNDEPGSKPSWESEKPKSSTSENRRSYRPQPFSSSFDTGFSYTPSHSASSSTNDSAEKRESYKEMSRRLDCKTEYIRNLLHDSASITVPLRSSGTVPRNHFNHSKGPAPQPPIRRRNPPTELVIPCEFCDTPIPHEELIQHETGCRPDLVRYNPRRRSPSPEYFTAPMPSSPEVDLPCEFCSDMIPASQLLRHQSSCI